MGGIGASEHRFSGGRHILDVPTDVTSGEAERPDAIKQHMSEVLADTAPSSQHLADRGSDGCPAGPVGEIQKDAPVEIRETLEERPAGGEGLEGGWYGKKVSWRELTILRRQKPLPRSAG